MNHATNPNIDVTNGVENDIVELLSVKLREEQKGKKLNASYSQAPPMRREAAAPRSRSRNSNKSS